MDMKNVKYVFFLRKPAVMAMKESNIEFEDIKHDWESKNLEVSIAEYKGKLFIGTINNQSGYPKLEENDIKHLKEIISEYKLK